MNHIGLFGREEGTEYSIIVPQQSRMQAATKVTSLQDIRPGLGSQRGQYTSFLAADPDAVALFHQIPAQVHDVPHLATTPKVWVGNKDA
jgi:hypothetical protein